MTTFSFFLLLSITYCFSILKINACCSPFMIKLVYGGLIRAYPYLQELIVFLLILC